MDKVISLLFNPWFTGEETESQRSGVNLQSQHGEVAEWGYELPPPIPEATEGHVGAPLHAQTRRHTHRHTQTHTDTQTHTHTHTHTQ